MAQKEGEMKNKEMILQNLETSVLLPEHAFSFAGNYDIVADNYNPVVPWNYTRHLKRIFDVIATTLITFFFAPLFLIVAAAIKLESRGPVFFLQTRVGKDGSTFKMFKFRSMNNNAETQKLALMEKTNNSGMLFKMKNDPRVTKIGRFIRKYSIDELPQLFNVIIGEMSLVGPRPALPVEVDNYPEYAKHRHIVLPGLTCTWQVSGRSEIDFAGQIKLDLNYIRNLSFLNDLKLIIRTVPTVLFAKGAY